MVGRLATCHPTGKDDGLGLGCFFLMHPRAYLGVYRSSSVRFCVWASVGGRLAIRRFSPSWFQLGSRMLQDSEASGYKHMVSST